MHYNRRRPWSQIVTTLERCLFVGFDIIVKPFIGASGSDMEVTLVPLLHVNKLIE